MSKKSKERRQSAIDRGLYQKKQVDIPPPEACNNSRICPTRENSPKNDKMTHCPLNYQNGAQQEVIHPIQYHELPQNQAPPPAKVVSPVDPMQGITFREATFLKSKKPAAEIKPPPQEGFDTSAFLAGDKRKVDLTEVVEEAATAMSKAMTPRNQEGYYLGIAYENQPQRAMVPYFAPNENGNDSPLIIESEFANGQRPENMSYEPGYVVGERDAMGNLKQKIIYDDPLKNLTPWQRKALDIGLQTMQNADSEQEEKVAEEKASALSRTSGFDAVIDDPKKGCLYFKSKSGLVQLTNFRVTAVESRSIHSKQSSNEPKVEYQLQIICGSISRTITLAPSELDNAVKLIQNKMPSCIVLPGVLKSNLYISNFIRQQLMTLPHKVYVQRTGFLKLNGAWQYVHDGAIPPADTVFDTGRHIPDDRRVSDAQAFCNAMAFLDICGKDELIIPLFLLAHLGPLFQLFHEAGRTPRFVTVLAGRSGSLKTSLSLVLFRLFQDQGQTPTASFRDTETAMEIKLGELNGSVGIFDDLRPPVSDLKSKTNIEKNEALIRAVGDHTAKSRSNTKLGKAKEFIPSGCALVTAEDLSGSQSSLLRCLVLSISKGDFDGAKLRRFQNSPDLIPTHMSRFLNWAGIHGDKIIGFIRNNYPNHLFEDVVTELRLVDTAATLMMTAHFLATYAGMCGAMNQEQIQAFMERCHNAICSAVVASEAMTREANPCTMYLSALFDLVARSDIRLADSITCYSAESCDGFLSAGCAWVDPKAIYAKIRSYYAKLNTVFPLSENQLAVHLADSELIEVSYESRDGRQKRLFTRKSSLPSRKRMMVIDIERAMSYLEENGNN